jgi:GT2 family glycosyltransferase
MTDVAVVVGNYNGAEVLPDCLGSLASQSLAPVEVVVVDGASSDGSADVTRAAAATFLERENRGLGYLYNEGLAATTAPFVFLANNDIAAEPDCLRRLVDALQTDDTAFASDARQLAWDGEEVIHARTTLSRGRLIREHLPGFHLDPVVRADGVVSTVCANGAAMLVRRSMFEELGGFDETFFMEWEDLDLCWRAWMRGWRTLYVPDAVVRHRVGAVTTAREQPRRSASSHHNLVRFALKCLPRREATRVVLGEVIRLPAHPRAIAVGLAQVARESAEIFRVRRALRPTPALLDAIPVGPA